MTRLPFITRVRLRNYRSIAACDVALGPLVFLVGRNGSGKSNFLDSLRFVADGLRRSLDHALRDRGGIQEVRRRSGGHPTHFGARLDFQLPNGTFGHYSFRIGALSQGGYEVQQEEAWVLGPTAFDRHYFKVRSGEVTASGGAPLPVAAPDRFYLVSASGLPPFRPLYDALTHMGFYNFNPDRIRDLQAPDPGELLARDGGNLAGVLARLERDDPAAKQRVEEYLGVVVPGLVGVGARDVGPREIVEFRQRVPGAHSPWRFPASSMSDGTLRTLGVLVAIAQGDANGAAPLVGIEEPEAALHPAAVGALLEALLEASSRSQVLVTSHSPDLLDSPEIPDDSVLGVEARDGVSTVGPLTSAARSLLRDGLYTAGELLRLDQLPPSPSSRVDPAQLRLFEEG
jgi:predicted ATPase